MSIFKLAFSNMRKRKGAAVTFLIMTLLAGLMLSVSLSLMIDGANFYETKVNELNAPHYRNDISLSYYKDEFLAYADGDGRVTETSVVDALGGTGDINRGSETVAANTVLLLHSETAAMQNSFFQPPVIDPAPQKTADSILLGLKFKSSGVRSGDKVRLAISNLSYEFTVCGFCEDPLYGYSTNSLTVAYLNDESYQEIQGDGNLLEILALLFVNSLLLIIIPPRSEKTLSQFGICLTMLILSMHWKPAISKPSVVFGLQTSKAISLSTIQIRPIKSLRSKSSGPKSKRNMIVPEVVVNLQKKSKQSVNVLLTKPPRPVRPNVNGLWKNVRPNKKQTARTLLVNTATETPMALMARGKKGHMTVNIM